jgi:DNA invertase Pin-like site-specific DNA recombinase
MLSYCEDNEIDTIVFESSNRLSRDLICMETGFQYLSSIGYTLISVDSPETFVENTPTSVLIRQVLGCISQFEKSSLVEKLRVSRKRKSKINKSKGYTSRTGRGKVEGVKKLTELNPELSGLVVKYRRKKDIRTKKSVSYMKISKLLEDEHNLSVSFNSVKRILDDVKDEKRNKRNMERRKSTVLV